MSARTYRQSCGVACSLDLIGERWTLLVVRELLLGPKRFGALQATLPGISTNLLSTRLHDLVDAGLVEQVRLPPPAPVSAYALTERGESLRPAVDALAQWGFGLLEPEAQHGQGWLARGSWLASTLAASASGRDDLPRLEVNCDVDGDRFVVRLGDGDARVRHGAAETPDAELTCSLPEFFALARGDRRPDDPALAPLFEVLRPAMGRLASAA